MAVLRHLVRSVQGAYQLRNDLVIGILHITAAESVPVATSVARGAERAVTGDTLTKG